MPSMPTISKIVRNLERYELWKDMGRAVGVYDKEVGRFGDLVKGEYSVHHSRLTPTKADSIFSRGLEPRDAPGGQPPLLFSWNTLNDAGLIPERSSVGAGEYFRPPSFHNAPGNVLAFLLKNNADTSFGRGGVPYSLTTRQTVAPEDLRVFFPGSYDGKNIPKSLVAKIPPESIIKMEDVLAHDILGQLFVMGIK